MYSFYKDINHKLLLLKDRIAVTEVKDIDGYGILKDSIICDYKNPNSKKNPNKLINFLLLVIGASFIVFLLLFMKGIKLLPI